MTWRNFTDISRSIVQSCLTLWLHGLQSARLLCAWDSPGKNTGVGCRFLLQGIFLTQWLNPHLLHWQADSFTTEPSGEPFTGIVLSKRNRTKKRMNEKREKRGRRKERKMKRKILSDSIYTKFDIREFYGDEVRTLVTCSVGVKYRANAESKLWECWNAFYLIWGSTSMCMLSS